ncbi:LysM peptidoglycan-binding domain-containing protein [Flavobacterium sp. CYK-55]|uniref:muramidase family protein n=1 Tax=Flavobacterium sp. CYK-55 TaxID=2835529 RepID=UPI001BCCE7EF|nr:LysM peptidoglycan-binding domain-containing protein [Flavobacterium sp. CYK-55]MBS7786901.1 LysM peptidoglycan-binding domain-containing protein [Flavobacterium sp. CYK-55]
MNKLLVLFFSLFFLCTSYSQTRKKEQEVDIVDHQVQFGETVRMISKKYLVDPAEIYKLNKFAVEGISKGMTLKVPVPRKESVSKPEVESTNKNETVAQSDVSTRDSVQESKSDEAQKQQVKPESTKGNNDSDVINSSTVVSSQPKKQEVKKIVIRETQTDINHKVLPKETLFSLSRTYSVSVDEIKAANPELASKGLQVGQTVKIPKGKTVDIQQSTSVDASPVTEKPVAEKKTSQKIAEVKTTESSTISETITHKVEPKETLYSLSRKYNVSVEEIKSQNEALLKNGLQIGQTLIIKK